jgi:hypothetical protein
LSNRLTTVENNYALKATPISGTYNTVTVNEQGIVTSGSNVDYATNSTVASVSGGLHDQLVLKQNEITLVAGSNITIIESPTDTWTISSTASSAPSSGGIYQGQVTCDITNASYRVNHPSIDLNYSFPTVSLIVPTSGSNLFVQGITNRSSTTFDVTLSEVPSITGYYISWHLPPANSELNNVPVVNLAVTNIPSYTTSASGSYNVTLSESVVYAEYENTVVLPSSPTSGESHWIVNIYTADVVIDGNGKSISLDGILYPTVDLTPDSSMHLHFNITKDRWYVI